MRVCPTCLRRHFTNASAPSGRADCDFCGRSELCSDIAARFLTPTEATMQSLNGESDEFLLKIIEADKRESAEPDQDEHEPRECPPDEPEARSPGPVEDARPTRRSRIMNAISQVANAATDKAIDIVGAAASRYAGLEVTPETEVEAEPPKDRVSILRHLVRNEIKKDAPLFYLTRRSVDGPKSRWRAYVVHSSEIKVLPPPVEDEWEVITYDPRASVENEVIGRILVESDVDVRKIAKVKAVVL